MKKHFIVPALLLAAIGAGAQTKPKPAVKPAPKTGVAKAGASANLLKTNKDSLSYAFGISLGEYLKSQGVESLNYAMLNKALEQCMKKQGTYFDFNVANAVISKVGQAKMEKTSQAERVKGQQFLTENKKRQGVKETASGLQYEILKAGNGPLPSINDTISAHYSGTLLNGTEFDNSYKRGEPLEIPVGGVIKGWTEALQMMPVGSKWKLFIPPAIAYGDYGAGNDIPGGATLVFEIELLDIVHKK